MAQQVVQNLDEFKAFLARQPLCQWAAQKQADIDSGKIVLDPISSPPKSGGKTAEQSKADAELAAALGSMA